MTEDLQNDENRHRSRSRSSSQGRSESRGSGRRGSSRHSRRTTSKASSKKEKFTIGQALLLLWSAGTLGAMLYLLNDVHRTPITWVACLGAAALVGLVFFFRTFGKKKRK